jgi:hypothetical protein
MNLTAGISIAIVAGSMNGLFPLSMKAGRQRAWENFWLPFSFLSLAVFPWVVAGFVAPHLLSAYNVASTNDLLSALACGILVYTGSLLFGLSLERIGALMHGGLLVRLGPPV